MFKSTVTSVIFVKNEEDYILDTLISIEKQTYTVTEIIIVDDGSKDKTIEKVQSFKSLPIKILYNKKPGKAYALELGLKHVKTDYFFIIAGDDTCHENHVASTIPYIIRNKLQFTYSNFYVCDKNLKVISKKHLTNSTFSFDDCLITNPVGGCLFAKRSVLDKLLPFPKNLQFEDWYCLMVLVSKFKKVHIFNQPTIFYRKHNQSTTANPHKNKEKLNFLHMRNIKLFEVLLASNKIIKKNKIAIFHIYHTYLHQFSFKLLLKILISPHVPLKVKIRATLYPLFKYIKYK